MIIAPSRELAAQIYHEALSLLPAKYSKSIVTVLPDAELPDQIAHLKDTQPVIIITTPLRAYEVSVRVRSCVPVCIGAYAYRYQ